MEAIMEIPAKIESIITQLSKLKGFESVRFDQLLEDTSPEVSLKILARFSVTLKECLDCVDQGLAEDNSDMVWKACHKVAGSAELLGFVAYGKLSRQLNVDVKSIPDLDDHESVLIEYVTEGRNLLSHLARAFPDQANFLQ